MITIDKMEGDKCNNTNEDFNQSNYATTEVISSDQDNIDCNDMGDHQEMKVSKNTEEKETSLNMNNSNMINRQAINEKSAMKARSRFNRELGTLNDNHILSSRLRSSSGKLYSSSVSVEAGTQTPSPASSLVAVAEEESLEQEKEEETTSMCPKKGCCQGTVKLMEMISKLQDSVDGVLKKVSTQEITSSNNAHRVHDLQEKVDQHDEDIDEVEKELKETKFQLQLVSNIVIKQDKQIQLLKQKIGDIQQREMAANIVISGIPEKKNEKPLLLFNEFVQEGLEIQELMPANRAFRIGTGDNRPLIVELRHPENKGKLFANASKLKGKRNEKGGLYFLSDHLPEEQNENRRRANELFTENKKKETSHQLEMSISKGKLIINQEPYEKSVIAPNARDLLEPNEALYEKADQISVVRGEDELKGGSQFISYAAEVMDSDDVQAALLKLQMKFADATHVSCAYKIQGANTPQNQDFVDDGEYRCGRTMLKVLKEEKPMNLAVFLVRYYGGKHLGVTRFEIFRKLAKAAIRALMNKKSKQEAQRIPSLPTT